MALDRNSGSADIGASIDPYDASRITFTQTGSSTQRTLDSILRETVSAKDFGAIGYSTKALAEAGTDSTAAIQAAIDSLPYDTTQNANIDNASAPYQIMGGGAVDLGGLSYLISDTILIPPRTTLTNGGLVADTNATWTDETDTGPILGTADWVTVTAGGTNYTQDTVSVVFSGGGSSNQAEGYAIVQNGAVIAVYITGTGEGYSSAPTCTISDSGTGAGATATVELILVGQPMTDTKVYNGEYSCFAPGIENITFDCNGVADGPRMQGKEISMDGVVSYNAKHCGFQFLGVDMGYCGAITSYSAGKYGVYTTYKWGGTTTVSGTNELSIDYLVCKWSGRAELKTVHSNAMNINYGNLRGSTTSINGLLNAATTGHTISIKVESRGESGQPVFVLGGSGHSLEITALPTAPVAHYKWVINLGTYNKVKMNATTTIMSQREANATVVDDISPFMSIRSQGLYVIEPPATNDSRLANIADWCRDMDGNSQLSSKFIMMGWGQGQSGALRTEKLDLSTESSASIVRRNYVSGDADERFAELVSGEMRWGDGTNPTDTILKRVTADTLGMSAGDSFRLEDAAAAPAGQVTSTLQLSDANGVVYHLWVDTTGDLRIHTTKATSELTGGTIVGTQSTSSVQVGITAQATAPAQATGTALIEGINEISVCANAGDAVTLPTAVAGLKVIIINNGANACDVFPAVSDDLGAGANIAVSLPTATNITYITYNDTNWEIV